jgi:hypothetical protein
MQHRAQVHEASVVQWFILMSILMSAVWAFLGSIPE